MRRGFVPWICCVAFGIVALLCSPLVRKAYDERHWVTVQGGTIYTPGDTVGHVSTIDYQPENYPLLIAFYATLALSACGVVIGLIGIWIEMKGGAPFASVARGFEVQRRDSGE